MVVREASARDYFTYIDSVVSCMSASNNENGLDAYLLTTITTLSMCDPILELRDDILQRKPNWQIKDYRYALTRGTLFLAI
jgi:hypothetical protein